MAGRITKRQIPQPIEDEEEEEEVEVIYRQTARPGEDPMPDMRFASNRAVFLRDESKTVDGLPDRRRIENRPDLQKLRKVKHANMKNLTREE